MKPRIIIADSGLGGLSVCAGVELALKGPASPGTVDIVYANAALADDFGYNDMTTRDEKIATFQRFLQACLERFEPALIYIACNTLSVLIEATGVRRISDIPVLGIVKTGAAWMSQTWQKRQFPILLFATETTIAEGEHRQRWKQSGIPSISVIPQACPGLAHAISNDEGISDRIETAVTSAVSRLPGGRSREVYAFLGCTHFGYQTKRFHESLTQAGVQARIMDPNREATREILGSVSGMDLQTGETSVSFWSRYALPLRERRVLKAYLPQQAVQTRLALGDVQVDPGFF